MILTKTIDWCNLFIWKELLTSAASTVTVTLWCPLILVLNSQMQCRYTSIVCCYSAHWANLSHLPSHRDPIVVIIGLCLLRNRTPRTAIAVCFARTIFIWNFGNLLNKTYFQMPPSRRLPKPHTLPTRNTIVQRAV